MKLDIHLECFAMRKVLLTEKRKCQVLLCRRYWWKWGNKQNWFIIYLKTLLKIFYNFAWKLSRLSSLNPLSFVIKCLTRFRDNGQWEAMRYRFYGNSCCLETDETINFNHMLKWWCSMKEIEVYLLCEISIAKLPPWVQKNCCEPP